MESTVVLAIDPGTHESAWCSWDGASIRDKGIAPNADVADLLYSGRLDYDLLAIEMVACYGMPVGAETFETCVWIGRFLEAAGCGAPSARHRLVYRTDVKLHLCGTCRAKDANVRQRLIDLYGAPGTKAKPGGTYGVRSHIWSAMAVAVTALEMAQRPS